MIFERNGAFRVEDIPAGTYELWIKACAAPVRRGLVFGEDLGSAQVEFDVPEMPGGRSDEPLDLGAIELTPP